MLKNKWAWTLGIGALAVGVLSGCGSTPTTASNTQTTATKSSNSTYVVGGAPFQGQKNLQSWEQKAKSNPANVKDLESAGISAYLNNQPQQAIQYYQAAAKLQPNNGLLWNNIGNVYRNTLHQDQTAISYYQKATKVDPQYDYGWYNWAYTLLQMKNTTAAKSVVKQAQAVLPKSDTLYKPLGELVAPPSSKPPTTSSSTSK